MNSRTSSILAGLQKHRIERKKPKRAVPLKTISLDTSQKKAVSNVQLRHADPPVLKKNVGRNSAAFSISIMFHVIIAFIISILFIANQIEKNKETIGIDVFVQEDKPTVRPPRGRDPVKFPTKQLETQQNIPQTPLQTAAALPLSDTGFTIPDDTTVDVGVPEISADDGPKIIGTDKLPGRPVGSEGVEIEPPEFELPSTQESGFNKVDNIQLDDNSVLGDFGDIAIGQNKPTRPKFKYKRKPDYPKSASRAQKEGQVLLQVTIDENGNPQNIVAITKLGFGFEEAAIAALQKSTFVPAMKDGKTISMTVQIPYDFTLEDE